MEVSKKRLQKKQKKQRKSKFRELTNTERILITLLSIVILFWMSFKFIIDPQLLKIANLESEIVEYNLEIQENNRILKNADLIIAERNELLLEKENIEKDFFKNLSQPEMIYILNELLLKSDIEMQSLTFSQPFTEVLNEKEISKMDISMPYKGTFKDLDDLIKKIEKEPRKMIINSIDLVKDTETEIVGDINLGIYSLTGLVDVEKDNILIETTSNNKSNPFSPYQGYIDPNKQVDQSVGEDKTEKPNTSEDNTIADSSQDKTEDKTPYETYTAVKGDNVSFISRRLYGDESYVNKILELNNMQRSSILPIGKELKLIKK